MIKLDVFADDPAQHLFDARDDLAQAKLGRLHGLAATEREQLLGQRGSAPRRRQNLVQIAALGVVLEQVLTQQLGVALDDHEQVVEVVRHAACQSPDGFHLLRLAELRFELTLSVTSRSTATPPMTSS